MAEPGQSIVYINGAYVPSDKASVSVFDHGLLYGDGVFDTMFASYGYIFKLDQHLARLARSLRAIRLDIRISLSDLKSAVIETVARNELDSAYIKVVGTRGVSAEPLLDPRNCTPTVVIFARPYLSLADPERMRAGLRAKLTSIRRVGMQALDPRIKSLNYLNLVLAQIEALGSDSDEALLLDDRGYVCEAPGYNIFLVRDGHVITPAESILEGITRETVLEMSAELGLETEVRAVAPYELFIADEVFLTSTAGGLVPVTSVDGQPVGSGKPGPTLSRLVQAYDALQESGRFGTKIARR